MLADDALFEANGRNMAVLFGSILVGTLANAAGVGGGAIYVPLFNIFIGFALKSSIALSQAVILAGALVSVALSMTKTHAHDPSQPLINYEVAVVITPILFVGVSMGVLLNVVLAEWLITFILLLLLTLLGVHAVIKGVRLWQQESRAFALALLPRPLSIHSRTISNTPDASARQPPSSFALAAISRTQRQGRTPMSLPTQFLPTSGSAPVLHPSISQRFSKSFKNIASSKSLGFFLENLEGLDFSVHNSASRFAVSTRGDSDVLDFTDFGIDEESPEGPEDEELEGEDAPAGISPRHSHIAGHSDPGRVCFMAASVPASAKVGSESPGLDLEFATGAAHGESPGLGVGRSWGQQALQTLPSFVPSLPHSHIGVRLTRLAGTTTASIKVDLTQVDRQSDQIRKSKAAVQEQPPVDTRLARTWSAKLTPYLPDYSHVPWRYVWQLLAVWLLYVGLQLGRTYAGRCTALAWGLYATQLCSMLLLGVIFTLRCRHEGQTKQLLNIPAHLAKKVLLIPSQSDVKSLSSSTDKELIVYSLVVFLSGVTTGLLGTGTGTVLGPLLLEMGLTPQVSSATASVTVLMACSAALIEYAVIGKVNLQFALIFGGAGMLSAVLAFTCVLFLLRHVQRASIIVITLASVIVGGALLVYIFGIRSAVEALSSHNWQWGNVCTS